MICRVARRGVHAVDDDSSCARDKHTSSIVARNGRGDDDGNNDKEGEYLAGNPLDEIYL